MAVDARSARPGSAATGSPSRDVPIGDAVNCSGAARRLSSLRNRISEVEGFFASLLRISAPECRMAAACARQGFVVPLVACLRGWKGHQTALAPT